MDSHGTPCCPCSSGGVEGTSDLFNEGEVGPREFNNPIGSWSGTVGEEEGAHPTASALDLGRLVLVFFTWKMKELDRRTTYSRLVKNIFNKLSLKLMHRLFLSRYFCPCVNLTELKLH